MMEGVLRLDDGRIGTPNLVPGKKVYDEFLVRVGSAEIRTWDPTRSKLGAYILKGGREWPFTTTSRVLYLGAANGTTPSHVSDICAQGVVVGVEFSPRSFRDLVAVAADRPNLVPVLADAWKPESYMRIVGQPDILYMDIAQREQARVFAKNLLAFKPKAGFFMIKARSIDVAREPREVYGEAAAQVESESGYRAVDVVELGPFEKDHAAVVFVPGGVPGERKWEPRRPPREERGPRPPRMDRGDRRGPPRGGGGGGGGGFQRGPPRDDRRGPPRGGGWGGKGPRKDFRKGDRR